MASERNHGTERPILSAELPLGTPRFHPLAHGQDI